MMVFLKAGMDILFYIEKKYSEAVQVNKVPANVSIDCDEITSASLQLQTHKLL
jgi:hypothetical protein